MIFTSTALQGLQRGADPRRRFAALEARAAKWAEHLANQSEEKLKNENAKDLDRRRHVAALRRTLEDLPKSGFHFSELGLPKHFYREARGLLVSWGWRVLGDCVWAFKPTADQFRAFRDAATREAEEDKLDQILDNLRSAPWYKVLPHVSAFVQDRGEVFTDELETVVRQVPGFGPWEIRAIPTALRRLGWTHAGRFSRNGKRRQLWRSVLV